MKLEQRSAKPVKVRKELSLSPIHDKSAGMLKASLSSDLKSKYGKNSVRVRIGDSVRLIRGEYSGVEGKIEKVYPSEGRLTIEGVTREKIKGGTSKIRIHSSNVIVTSLNLDDKMRRQKVEGVS